jgi:hypothetical protein
MTRKNIQPSRPSIILAVALGISTNLAGCRRTTVGGITSICECGRDHIELIDGLFDDPTSPSVQEVTDELGEKLQKHTFR